jgi:diadenosine tetraphosphate (Ap4A) HIT family hydrolase
MVKLVDLGGGLTRKCYEDDVCFGVLESEQSVKGYVLLILKNHYDTVSDKRIQDDELVAYWRGAQELIRRIKERLGAEMVYAVTLCEGVRHYHNHLIPRYANSDIGFQYMARIEREYTDIPFNKLLTDDQRHIELHKLADLLCTT